MVPKHTIKIPKEARVPGFENLSSLEYSIGKLIEQIHEMQDTDVIKLPIRVGLAIEAEGYILGILKEDIPDNELPDAFVAITTIDTHDTTLSVLSQITPQLAERFLEERRCLRQTESISELLNHLMNRVPGDDDKLTLH